MYLKRAKAVDITSLTVKAKQTWIKVRRASLYLGGLGCFTAAAWSIGMVYGLVVAGASLFVVEMLTEDDR
jgi:hypothetical protein